MPEISYKGFNMYSGYGTKQIHYYYYLFQTSEVCMPQAQHDREIGNGHAQTVSAFV